MTDLSPNCLPDPPGYPEETEGFQTTAINPSVY